MISNRYRGQTMNSRLSEVSMKTFYQKEFIWGQPHLKPFNMDDEGLTVIVKTKK